MTNKVRTHMMTETPRLPTSAPKEMVKQDFGKRLTKLMRLAGWQQSDLARAAGLPRDSISVYVRGKSLPTPKSLDKLAAALKVPPEDLLPTYIESAIDDDIPELEIRVSPNAPHLAWLRINQHVTRETADAISRLLTNDKPVVNAK